MVTSSLYIGFREGERGGTGSSHYEEEGGGGGNIHLERGGGTAVEGKMREAVKGGGGWGGCLKGKLWPHLSLGTKTGDF